jgi:hypothetical protein
MLDPSVPPHESRGAGEGSGIYIGSKSGFDRIFVRHPHMILIREPHCSSAWAIPILLRVYNSGRSDVRLDAHRARSPRPSAWFPDGQRIAQQSAVAWFPLIVRLVAMVVAAYQLSSRGRITGRGIVAFGLAAGGVMAFLDGITVAVTEESRARYGRVSSGVVVEKFSSSGAQGTRRIGRRGGRDQQHTRPVVTANGFAFYDPLARLIVTGSADAWAVDYRLSCVGGRTCLDRDFVTEEQWLPLRAGSTVNVRQADWETMTSRIDGNPRWATAFADLGIGSLLLTAAALLSGRLVLFRRRRWLAARSGEPAP